VFRKYLGSLCSSLPQLQSGVRHVRAEPRGSSGFARKQWIPNARVNCSGNLQKTWKFTFTRSRQDPECISKYLNDSPVPCTDAEENPILLYFTPCQVIGRFGSSIIPSRITYQSTRREIPKTFVLKWLLTLWRPTTTIVVIPHC